MSVAQLDTTVASEVTRLTILHLTAPATVGGLEKVVEALATGHARAGHEVHVAAVLGGNDPDPEMFSPLLAAGVRVHVLRVEGRGYRAERIFVARLCRQLRPSVVHTHGFRSDVVDGRVARRLGLPTVTTVHGFTRNGWRGRFYEWIQRRSHRGFSAVVAVSSAQTVELLAAGVSPARLTVLRNAWCASGAGLARPEARSALGIPESVPHVAWVGRLSEEKGPDVFIEGLGLLAGRGVDVHASLIGDGPLRASLTARVAELGLADRIAFHGQLPDARRFFPGFDVFVISSRTEGAPIVLFEAMAAGVPVVASAVGGIPEIIGEDEAVLVAAEDPNALADAIAATVRSPELAAARARAATARLRAEFAEASWLSAYESIYQQARRNLSGKQSA